MTTTDTLANTGLTALTGAMSGRVSALSAAASGQTGTGQTDMEAVRKSAESFESMFISQMLQPMFETIDTGGMFGGGNAEKMWRSMMVDEYGKMVTKSGGIGVADSVMKVMLANQEA
jgi:Rod binding domain-containing protein